MVVDEVGPAVAGIRHGGGSDVGGQDVDELLVATARTDG
jgi:hypothetical protein